MPSLLLPLKRTCPFPKFRTFDENQARRESPHCLAILLKNLGHEAHTLHEEKLAGRSDVEVWNAAQKESRFLITQDLDFSDLRKFAPGSHHGILLLRLRTPSRGALIGRIEEMFKNENVEEWAGCFVVATDRKIRLLKPQREQKP